MRYWPLIFAISCLFTFWACDRPKIEESKNENTFVADTLAAGQLLLQANALNELAEYEQALKVAKKAEKIYDERLGEAKESLPGYFNSCKIIGDAFKEIGDLDRALDYYLKALALSPTAIDPLDSKVGKIHNNIGLVFFMLGQLENSLKSYEEARRIFMNAMDKNKAELAVLESNIGAVHIIKQDYVTARAFQKKGLKLLLSATKIDSTKLSLSYLGLAANFICTNDYDSAIIYAKKALQIRLSKLGEIHPGVGEAYFFLGESYLRLDEYYIADSFFNKALYSIGYTSIDSLGTVNDVPFFIYILEAFGRSQKQGFDNETKIDRLLKSRAVFKDAVEVLKYQAQRLGIVSNALYAEQTHDICGEALNTNYELYLVTDSLEFLNECFHLAEHAKSILLLEAVKESGAQAFAGIPTTLVQKENNLKNEIAQCEKLVHLKFEKGFNSIDSSVTRILDSIFKMNKDLENLRTKLKEEYPSYYNATLNLSTIPLSEIQQTLQPKQTLLEYFIGYDSIYLFAIRPDTFKVVAIKKDFPLKEYVENMRQGMYGSQVSNMPLAQATGMYVDASLRLYEKIFAPINGFLAGTEELVIIPDGVLGYLPFDALLAERPADLDAFAQFHYLLKDYQISYCYSATLLREMQQKQHWKAASKNYLGVAPYFPGGADAIAYDQPGGLKGTLSPLQYNVPEVEGIQRRIGGNLQIGQNATEQAFTDKAQDYRILHLSTHGMANDQVGDYSFLAFTEIPDSIENERLYNRELYNLRLNADLVVLSACETGIGELQRGEGIISLARGFSYAGAKSIVTTLWSVSEKPTMDLMESFYKYLQNGMAKDAALRQAKLDLLQSSTPEPFFWAGFIPIGDMAPVSLEGGGVALWIWVLAAAFGGLILILWRRYMAA
ncbi:MAG: CHAT domain-containing protein [Saprospiraceae bacterium]|nr:CHAT domain-containing protein [Saprospiraceae bacterium]